MNHYAQIKVQLKMLKLSGILQNLELRMQQAQQDQLAYSEFLSLLLSDEIDRRTDNKIQRLLYRSRIPVPQTLDSFDFSANPSINAAYICELATCEFVSRGENVFLIGPTGTGRTHLAKALCHQACLLQFSVAFYRFHDFFAELERAELHNQLHKHLKKLFRVDLLAIDDFAFKKISPEQAELLYTVVDARYQAKSLILTSNRAIPDWSAIFPDPLMANAILDRMAHYAHQILIKGESYRKKSSPILQNP